MTPFREAPPLPAPLVCPRDRSVLASRLVEDTPLHVCELCAGLWIDAEVLERLLADRIRMDGLALHPVASPWEASAPTVDAGIACLRCAAPCTRHSYRVTTNLVVDTCRAHGMWLDGGELAAVIHHERSPRRASGAPPPPEPRTFEQDEARMNRVLGGLSAILRFIWWL
jgi:Zn-finger nucleic acid-binding protein